MMNSDNVTVDFFVAGGTLRPDSPSYVKRPSDDELFNLASGGEFCYVLTARQMGKSSLMIRAGQRLRAEGVRAAIIDLTKIGADVSVEKWYLGLLTQLKRRLKLSVDPEAWWSQHATLGNVQRFTDFLHDVVLTEIEERVVILIDEIDTTLNLAFSDDFFAAIRFVYNARATDPAYKRLTFILLGVATPADLIKDRKRTPFNIGQGVDLSDFSQEDASVLRQGLIDAFPERGEAIFNRIFHWTNGHPYLTQKLCLVAVETRDGNWSDERVDALVERLFLSKEAVKETNLQFVRDSVRVSSQRGRLLSLYRQVYTGKMVPEDERSLDQNQLKLFGLVRVEDRTLKVRNEIYCHVFNLDWIKANTPVDWTRRIVVISALIIFLLIAGLGFSIYQQRQPAISEQAREYAAGFRNAANSDERITQLAGLFDLPDYQPQAQALFYDELTTSEERMALFEISDPQAVGPKLIVVVKGLYTTLENNEQDNILLLVMAEPLRAVDDVRASSLAIEIDQWLQGRDHYMAGEYDQAVAVYGVVLTQNDQNPGIYFDRALAHAALNEWDEALADFEMMLRLDEERQSRVKQEIMGNPDLYDAFWGAAKDYPQLVAFVSTPTPSPTTTPTATPTPTHTPTRTPTPVPTATPTVSILLATLAASSTPTQTPSPTSTPSPTNTPTPTITPTSTPRPAQVVYVQSNGETHSLGMIRSGGAAINESLHLWAAAPAWSPDGGKVAFFGESGLNALGGIYALGNGIWMVDVHNGNVQQLFQIDHVKNIAWSPDGQKLAFEIGPPGVTHEVMVIDAVDGRELKRFPGQQPTWSPNSQELAIKTCNPDCGLWKVGFDGGGGKRLTYDGTDSYPTWSSDGQYLAFTSSSRTGDWEIYRLQLDSSEDPVQLTEQHGSDTTPVFSPDGLEIYFRSDAFGGWQVRVMAVDGANQRAVRENVGASDDWGLARPAAH